MSFVTADMDHLIVSELWSTTLKEVLQDDLQAKSYVDWMSNFPHGDTFTIPSIGQAEVDNYVEDTAVKYRAMDTGEFQFTITEYVQSGHYMTEKMKQDAMYASQVLSSFIPKQARALAVRLERDIFALAAGGASGGQTASDPNVINGADHRWVGSGTNETMDVVDFAKAWYSLNKANVPTAGRIAIVDPSVEFKLNTLTNLVNFSNDPKWEGLLTSGINPSGMRFIRNIFGFDVYVSNYLADANETITATGGSALTTAAGKANIFCSLAGSDIKPFKGAWRQMPKVDSGYNKDFQRDEYVTTARYGLKVYRPENLVVVLTDTDQIVV
jgi:hypothetical protein